MIVRPTCVNTRVVLNGFVVVWRHSTVVDLLVVEEETWDSPSDSFRVREPIIMFSRGEPSDKKRSDQETLAKLVWV